MKTGIKRGLLLLMIFTGMVSLVFAEAAQPARFNVVKSAGIDEVTSDFPVRFCLLTAGRRQYVAYYNKERAMTVASRMLDSEEWCYQVLPSKVGWDSHNYITMAVDGNGDLHVAGNMHAVKLVYFRTKTAGDIATLERLSMTGRLEDGATYPNFLTDAAGTLIFNYRDGGSGNGKRLYNKYDLKTKTWSRLLNTPLLDGEGERNAYPMGPVRGPDGWFHLVWVWRDTPDCATNHHLSYARSKDLIYWESAFGKKVELPLKLNERVCWVDPIPSGGGMINGCEKLFFDENHRPIISYHKSDAAGNMQVYAARPEGAEWVPYRLTDWSTPVIFSGGGSMGDIGIRISGLKRVEPGILTLTYRHRDYGSGRLVVDEKTLLPMDRTIDVLPDYPAELGNIQSEFEGMTIQRAEDRGDSGDADVRYLLQWETLGRNRDRTREPPLPEPSVLRLYTLEQDAMSALKTVTP